MNLPRARRDDVLVTDLDDEVVVYDPDRKQAHSLNRTAVAIWNRCDGTKTIPELKRLASDDTGIEVDEEAVWLAIRKLERAHLLLGKIESAGSITRREVLGKAGRMGAAAMATPLIASALVPTPAAAVSACGVGHACSPPPPGFTNACVCAVTIPAPGNLSLIACVNFATQGAFCNTNADCAANGSVCVQVDGFFACFAQCNPSICPCQ